MFNTLRMMGSASFNAGPNSVTGTIGSGYAVTMGLGSHQPSSSGAGAATFVGLPGSGIAGMMGSYLVHPAWSSSVQAPGNGLPSAVIAGDLHPTMIDIMQDALNGDGISPSVGTDLQFGVQHMLEVMDDIQLVGLNHMSQLFSPIVP